jgi:hypothetical protein
MKLTRRLVPTTWFVVAIMMHSVAIATQDEFSTSPTKNNVERWHIAYYEGGRMLTTTETSWEPFKD